MARLLVTSLGLATAASTNILKTGGQAKFFPSISLPSFPPLPPLPALPAIQLPPIVEALVQDVVKTSCQMPLIDNVMNAVNACNDVVQAVSVTAPPPPQEEEKKDQQIDLAPVPAPSPPLPEKIEVDIGSTSFEVKVPQELQDASKEASGDAEEDEKTKEAEKKAGEAAKDDEEDTTATTAEATFFDKVKKSCIACGQVDTKASATACETHLSLTCKEEALATAYPDFQRWFTELQASGGALNNCKCP